MDEVSSQAGDLLPPLISTQRLYAVGDDVLGVPARPLGELSPEATERGASQIKQKRTPFGVGGGSYQLLHGVSPAAIVPHWDIREVQIAV